MAYQALYRKYRPQTFSDVVGQEPITETLKNELAAGKTVHAYLFTGTRGTGKTSCAKILAKAMNCLSPESGDPCLSCASCLSIAEGENTDIVEIDAASNNSVDSIRELRDQVLFAPASSKYRVYIIDEVHMLTVSAFNALLKTLEEPPKHVVFILATTEVHKLPATILSRCQRFDFRRIEPEKICERIQFVAGQEGFSVTPEAASLIASAADGGMRDALSILDLCASSSREIDEKTVENVCGMAGNDYLIRLADCVRTQNTEQALLLLDELHNSSVDMQRLLSELIGHYRDLMIIKTVKGKNRPIVCSTSRLQALEEQAAALDMKDIMTALSVLQDSCAGMQNGNRRCEMEMALIRLCEPALSPDLAALEKRVSRLEAGIPVGAAPARPAPTLPQVKPTATETEEEIPLPEAPDEPPAAEPDVPAAEKAAARPDRVPSPAGVSDGRPSPVEAWDEILNILKKTCPLIAGVLQGSSAYIKGSYLLIDAPNGQFRSMINSGSALYRDNIRKAAQQVLGTSYKLGPYNSRAESLTEDPLAAVAERLKQLGMG